MDTKIYTPQKIQSNISINKNNDVFDRSYSLLKNANNTTQQAPPKTTTIDLDCYAKDEDVSVKAENFDTSKISNDGYTVQGFTYTNDKMLVSAYKKNYLSIIYVYNKNGELEGKIYTDTVAHVGGLTFDYKNKILFMSDKNGKTVAYDYVKLMEKKEKDNNYEISLVDTSKIKIKQKIDDSKLEVNNDVRIDNNIAVNDLTKVGKNSTMYSFADKIYVATYDTDSKGQLVEFNTEYKREENTLFYDDTSKIDFIKNVQGVAVTAYKGKKYLLATQSVGTAPSQVLLYDITDGIEKRKYIGKENLASGAEGIDVGTDGGKVTIVNEKFDSITQFDFETLYKDCNSDDSIIESGEKFVADIYQEGNNAAANISDTVKDVSGKIGDTIKDTKDKVTDVTSSLKSGIEDIAKEKIDVVSDAIDDVIDFF